MKNKIKEIKERIKKSNFYKLIKFKSEINDLSTKIKDLEGEKRELIDLYQKQKTVLKSYKNNDIKVVTYEALIERTDKELKKKLDSNKKLIQKNKELSKENEELQTKLFENDLEVKRLSIQIEEYKAQIEDLRAEGRYIVKKVRAGRTPNTNKTKISKPMSGNVTRYMRGEHE